MKIIDELPPYLYCDDPGCDNKHFLTFNRDIQGKWTIGYVEFETGGSIAELSFNGSDSIEEAVTRVKAALKRSNKF